MLSLEIGCCTSVISSVESSISYIFVADTIEWVLIVIQKLICFIPGVIFLEGAVLFLHQVGEWASFSPLIYTELRSSLCDMDALMCVTTVLTLDLVYAVASLEHQLVKRSYSWENIILVFKVEMSVHHTDRQSNVLIGFTYRVMVI